MKMMMMITAANTYTVLILQQQQPLALLMSQYPQCCFGRCEKTEAKRDSISCPSSHIFFTEKQIKHSSISQITDDMSKRKWKLNMKSNFCFYLLMKAKFFRLNLKISAYFLKDKLSFYSEHLHSSFTFKLLNSSLKSL